VEFTILSITFYFVLSIFRVTLPENYRSTWRSHVQNIGFTPQHYTVGIKPLFF
jgi:hypothetical protein